MSDLGRTVRYFDVGCTRIIPIERYAESWNVYISHDGVLRSFLISQSLVSALDAMMVFDPLDPPPTTRAFTSLSADAMLTGHTLMIYLATANGERIEFAVSMLQQVTLSLVLTYMQRMTMNIDHALQPVEETKTDSIPF